VTDPVNAQGLAELNGNPLPQAARWVGDAGIRVEQPVSTGNVYAYTDMSTRSQMNGLLYTSKEFELPSLTQWGLRLGYTWAEDKYDVAVFCRNCGNQIRTIGVIDFDNLTGYINDPRVYGAQFRAKF
jgi:iron complex outermembrane receptor protein